MFDIHFQRGLLATLLTIEEIGRDLALYDELPEAFDSELYQQVSRITGYFYVEFGKPPSFDQLSHELQKRGWRNIEQHVKVLFTIPPNPDYYAKEAYTFITGISLRRSAESSLELLQQHRVEEARKLLERAAIFRGALTDIGLKYFESFEREAEPPHQYIPFGCSCIDYYMGGGLGPGELGVILGPPNIGKSQALIWAGSTAILFGKKVVHYTLEMSVRKVRDRYDACLTNLTHEELRRDLTETTRRLQNLSNWYQLQLFIKQYPTSSASINTLRAHLNTLKSIDFTPDLVVVDYADILRAEATFFQEERRIAQGELYKELRKLAGDLSLPVWTGCQTNRSALDKSLYGLEAIGESFEKAKIADVIIALCQDSNMEKQGILDLVLVKNRDGRRNVGAEATYDFSRSQLIADPHTVIEF